MSGIQVTKRDSTLEPLDYNKIHFVLEEAVKGLSGVSVSDIEMNASLQLYHKIRTVDIHKILIKSAVDLIGENTPNYEIVAARLTNYNLRKEVFGGYRTIHLADVIESNVKRGVYDPKIVEDYSLEHIEKLNQAMNHSRDDLFKAAGIQQCIDKYLLKDRDTDEIFETPQYMYMTIAMTLFANYKRYGRKKQLQTIIDYYDEISQFNINLPTPILCGARTPLRQYSSCVLIDVDDTMDGIIHSDGAITKYTSQRAGIGINAGRIRAINSKIRGGEVVHTGVIPFLKKFEASVKSCTQNGVRGGSATTHFPFWHKEIEDIIVLKNNKGTEDNRVRKLDYSIQLNNVFYKRVAQGEQITLFSPHDVPELYENFGSENFEELYETAERRIGISTKKVSARGLFVEIIKERIETGRIYIMNIDNCNTHSSFTVPIRMSNLCQEITLPTKPISDYHDEEGEIALCILSAINLGNIDTDKLHEQMERRCELAIRALDEIVDLQGYPLKAARNSTLKRRSLGVGYIGLAHFLAKNKVKFCSRDASTLMHRVTESFQYHLIKASNKLAQEVGPCEGLSETKYGQGILPIDTYSKAVDRVHDAELELDWEELRSLVKQYGVRNSTLSAQMPSESSSVTSNETNGVEAPRSPLTVKKSKKGLLKMVVPEYRKYKEYYQFTWDDDYDNKSYTETMATVQKFFDQAISLNDYWNPARYPNNELPIKEVMRHLMYAAKLGAKTAYYLNTYDGKEDSDVQDDAGCESGACAI